MNIFKKKNESELQKDASPLESNDLPDELPTLASDIVEKAEDTLKDEVPSELPALDEFKDEPKIADVKEIKEKNSLEQKSEPAPSIEKSNQSNESFFDDVLKRIKKSQDISDRLIFDMKKYWEMRENLYSDVKSQSEKELEKHINIQVIKLKELEQEWINKKKQLEKNRKELESLEIDMMINTQQFRDLLAKNEEYVYLRELDIKKNDTHEDLNDINVPMEKGFFLRNGKIIRNIKELIYYVAILDENEFRYYCLNNDFSNWIRHVLKKEEIAEKIKNLSKKEEIIEILKKNYINNLI